MVNIQLSNGSRTHHNGHGARMHVVCSQFQVFFARSAPASFLPDSLCTCSPFRHVVSLFLLTYFRLVGTLDVTQVVVCRTCLLVPCWFAEEHPFPRVVTSYGSTFLSCVKLRLVTGTAHNTLPPDIQAPSHQAVVIGGSRSSYIVLVASVYDCPYDSDPSLLKWKFKLGYRKTGPYVLAGLKSFRFV